MIFTRFAMDTIDFQIPNTEYKVLVYADSLGCTGCKLQLHKWKELIKYIDSITQRKIPFLFFIHPKDRTEIQYLLRGNEFDIPVCIDLDNKLNRLNHLKADTSLQVFLLDKNNKVSIYGNTNLDMATKELYLKQITGKECPSKNLPQTTAKATQTEIDFGTFEKSQIRKTTIEIKNTGDSPLVIFDVNTTCGCTAATYDKRPAFPEKALLLEIKMTPKSIGFFNETVTVTCNTAECIKIRIRGQVQ